MRTQAKPNVEAPREPMRDPIAAVFDEAAKEATADGESTELATVRAPLQQVRTQYTTALAVQRPRQLKAVLARIVQEAELCGEDFLYSWTQGGKLVEGPSIDGAMIMVRNFGNCAAESRVAEEGPAHWLLDAAFIDLETGFTLSRQFRQRKGEAHQKKGKDGDGDRLLDIAFQIGQSKAQRNVIVRAMPEWLVKRAMTIAKDSAEKEYRENLPGYLAKAKAAFEKLGVTVAEIEAKLGAEDGQPKPEASWTVSDVRVLSALHRAILARETDVVKEFRTPKPGEPAATSSSSSTAQPTTATPATPANTPPAASKGPPEAEQGKKP